MPVPRRLDRRPPEQDLTRTNERITAAEVRLIDQEGQQVGVLKTPEALRFAQDRDLDLVEVAPQARPPVARVLDYSKYKYEQAQKQKQARKHQQQITVREIKFRPKIAQHDYDTKKGHVVRFLLHKYKVKITIMFRGREVAHPERGVAILDRLAEELSELAVVEQSPTLDGRNMAMLLAPSKGVLSGSVDSLHAAANGGPADEAADEAAGETAAAETPTETADAPSTPEPAPAASVDGKPDVGGDAAESATEEPGASAPQPAAGSPDGADEAPAQAEARADAKPPATEEKAPAAAERKPRAPRSTAGDTGGQRKTDDEGAAPSRAKSSAKESAAKPAKEAKAPAAKPSRDGGGAGAGSGKTTRKRAPASSRSS